MSADTSLTFSWTDNDPDNNNLTYSFYIGNATQMLNLYQSGITGNSLKIDGLQLDSTYIWSLVASDGQASTQGPIWSFRPTHATGIEITNSLIFLKNILYSKTIPTHLTQQQ